MAFFDGVRRAFGFPSRSESGTSPERLALPTSAAPELALASILSPESPAAHRTPTAYARQWDGEKFQGGIFDNQTSVADWTDYETIRCRSEEIFQRNVYARGLVRRLVTNIIHTGLQLEATPIESVIGRPVDSMLDWAEDVETRFKLWGDTPFACHHSGLLTWGQLQSLAKTEAIVGGDCLVVLRQNKLTKLPTVEIISASSIVGVASNTVPAGHTVDYGVERDAAGRHIAFHVQDFSTGEFRTMRIPAFDRSGRRVAWMIYGNDRRTHTVRGEPLLATVIQSLKEVDKYRDSVQRKAVVNSILAMYISKEQPSVGTLPLSNAAVASGTDSPGYVDGSGDITARTYSIAEQIPGVVVEELNPGEKPVGFDSRGIDISFRDFEQAMISTIAWSLQIPPEIATLAFSSNYSASQAALNEFRIFLSYERTDTGIQLLQPVYSDWLLSEGLRGSIDIGSYMTAAFDPSQFDVAAAWTSSDWAGAIKPTTDPLKQVNAQIAAIDAGLTTRELATKELNGRKYALNIRKLKRENEALAEALEPLAPPAPVIETPPADDDADAEPVEETDEEETETDE